LIQELPQKLPKFRNVEPSSAFGNVARNRNACAA
jgi:hypothetical protein